MARSTRSPVDSDHSGHHAQYTDSDGDDEDHSHVADIIHIMDQEIVRFRANNSEQGIVNSGSVEFELEPETEQPMEHQTLSEVWAEMTPRHTGPRWKDVAAGDDARVWAKFRASLDDGAPDTRMDET